MISYCQIYFSQIKYTYQNCFLIITNSQWRNLGLFPKLIIQLFLDVQQLALSHVYVGRPSIFILISVWTDYKIQLSSQINLQFLFSQSVLDIFSQHIIFGVGSPFICKCSQLNQFLVSEQNKTMKVVKLEPGSLQKHKETADREAASKKASKSIRKRLLIDPFNKKMDLQSYDPRSSYHETQNNSPKKSKEAENKSNELIDNQTDYIVDEVIYEQVKPSSKSILKLPSLHTNNIIRAVNNNLAGRREQNKKQSNEVIDMFFQGSAIKREPRRTFHAHQRGFEKNSLKSIEDKSANNNNGQTFSKLIKIQSVKPSPKTPHQYSMRQIDISKIQRTVPIKRQNNRNESENSLCKADKASEEKNNPVTRVSETNSCNEPRKQRKVLSILRNHSNHSKKSYAVSYLDFCLFMAMTNKMYKPSEPVGTYKAFVGKGNNSILVKSTLKNRFWWNVTDIEGEVNLLWTQQRDNKFLQTLKPNLESKKVEKKKIEFILSIPKENERNDPTKRYCRIGFSKLLSPEEIKRFSKNPYHVEVPANEYNAFESPNKMKIHNHLQFNWNLTNKKALYYNMKSYYLAMSQDPFNFIPLTFHVKTEQDQEWKKFLMKYQQRQGELTTKPTRKKKEKNLWIIKPGQNSNQGCGIDVADSLEQIREIIKVKAVRPNGKGRSHIIQRYLMPFLYNKRKFDIRAYILVTSVNSIVKAYWYQEGYIRTSCKDFTVKNLKNKFIHLTNDAIQKKAQDYGKFENGNKVSFNDFQKYLDIYYPEKAYSFYDQIYPRMMRLAADSIKATYMLLDANKRQYSFEILGLDYMIDEQFNTWLIEVNNNPCLELGSPLLARIIPNMIENAFKIAIDPIFPPPKEFPKSKSMATDLFEFNKFTLIFNSNEEGEILKSLIKDVNLSGIIESDEEQEGIQEDLIE